MDGRADGWRDRLSELIAERRASPFEWGTHDCALWTCDCVLAVTGVDPARSYRGQYDSAAGALRALRSIDSVRLPEQLSDKVFGPRYPVALARAGDVVLCAPEQLGQDDPGLGLAMGVCYGATSFFAGEHGLVELDTLSLECCYHV